MTQTTQKADLRCVVEACRRYVGEAPDDGDYETVRQAIGPLVAMLAADPRCGVVIEDINAIEDRFYPALVLLLAVRRPRVQGRRSAEPRGQWGFGSVRELQAAQMTTLKVIVARPPTYKTLQAQCFDDRVSDARHYSAGSAPA